MRARSVGRCPPPPRCCCRPHRARRGPCRDRSIWSLPPVRLYPPCQPPAPAFTLEPSVTGRAREPIGVTLLGRRRAGRSLQIVHSLGGGECPRTPGAIAAGIEPLGARHGRIECGLGACIGLLDRTWRRLLAELRPDRLDPKGPRIRVASGLPHGLLELRDRLSARAGLRRCNAETQGGGDNGCGRLSVHDRSCVFTKVDNRLLRSEAGLKEQLFGKRRRDKMLGTSSA